MRFPLDPMTVIKLGARWTIVDGHHRLAAQGAWRGSSHRREDRPRARHLKALVRVPMLHAKAAMEKATIAHLPTPIVGEKVTIRSLSEGDLDRLYALEIDEDV